MLLKISVKNNYTQKQSGLIFTEVINKQITIGGGDRRIREPK